MSLNLLSGFESNLHNNVKRKKAKYKDLIEDQRGHFSSVKFVNLSMSSLGVFDKECFTFLEMLDTIGMNKKQQHYCIMLMPLERRTIFFAVETKSGQTLNC
jgi:hypothetical protein